jgi:hypothetical protein
MKSPAATAAIIGIDHLWLNMAAANSSAAGAPTRTLPTARRDPLPVA